MKTTKLFFANAIFMLALSIVLHSFTTAKAQVYHKPVVSDETVNKIRFVQMDGEMLVFELSLNNLPQKGSMLRIADGEGNVLFEERINATTHNVRYKIRKGDFSKINFEVSGKYILLNQSFTIKSKVEEKTEVTKA